MLLLGCVDFVSMIVCMCVCPCCLLCIIVCHCCSGFVTVLVCDFDAGVLPHMRIVMYYVCVNAYCCA